MPTKNLTDFEPAGDCATHTGPNTDLRSICALSPAPAVCVRGVCALFALPRPPLQCASAAGERHHVRQSYR